jgi:hypothetical protein
VGLLELIAVADVALYRAKSAGRNLAVHCRNYWSEPCMSPELLKGQCGRCESQQSRACIVTRI